LIKIKFESAPEVAKSRK